MTRPLVLALLVTVIISGSLYVLAARRRGDTLASADTALAARARLIADMVDHTLQWRMSEAFTFAALPSLRGFAASDAAARPARMAIALVELKGMVAADQNIRAVSIVDPSGAVILATDDSMTARWGDRLYVRQAMAGQLYASPPSRDGGEVSQYYSAPIIDNAGSVAAGLVVRVSAQELSDALGTPPEVMLVDEEGVRIVDRTGTPRTFTSLVPLAADVAARVLFDRRYGAEVTQVKATSLSTLADAIKRNRPAVLSYQNVDGKTVRAATQPTAIYPWTVVVFQDEEVVFSPVRDALIGIGAASLVGLLVGALLGISFRRPGPAN